MPYMQLPDGSSTEVPVGVDYEAAMEAAKHQFPEAFGIEQQHGLKGAFKSALGKFVSASGETLADVPGLEGIKSLTATDAEQQAPGAWRPLNEEDWTKAKANGLSGRLGYGVTKAAELAGGMGGRYAVPSLAAMGAGAVFPPAAWATAPAAFIAANEPAQLTENRERVEQQLKSGELTQDPGKYGAEQVVVSLAQGLIGAVGGPGTQTLKRVLPMLGPEIGGLAKLVSSGAMDLATAQGKLFSVAKNYGLQTIQHGVAGAELMAGTEALTRAQAGQELNSPEAWKEYAGGAEMGASIAPFMALAGLRTRGKQVKALEGANKEWLGANEAAQAYGGDREQVAAADAAKQTAVDQAAAQRAAIPVGEQLGLDIPEQPAYGQRANIEEELAQRQAALDALNTLKKAQLDSGMKDDAGETTKQIKQKVAEINYVKQAALKSRAAAPEEVAPTEAPAITRADFNEMGIPNDKAGKEVRAYEGVAAGSAQMGELRDTLGALVNPDTAPKWMTDEKAAKIQAKLDSPLLLGEQQGLDMSFPTAEQARGQAWDARMQQGREAAKAAQPGAVRDMFTGEPTVVDQRAPEPKPVRTQAQYAQRESELYAKFLETEKRRQQTGDESEMQQFMAQAQAELGPFAAKQMRAGTQELPFKKGYPDGTATDIPTEPARVSEQGAAGAGNGEPVPVPRGPESGTTAEPVGAGVLPDERPAVGEKPVAGALDRPSAAAEPVAGALDRPSAAAEPVAGALDRPSAAAEPVAGALTSASKRLTPVERQVKKAAETLWNSKWQEGEDSIPTYKALAPEAKDLLHARIDTHPEGLGVSDFQAVEKAHRAAERTAARENPIKQDPDAFMYSKRGPGEQTGPAATTESFNQAAIALLGGEKNYNKSKVQVYHTFADLPEELQKAFTEDTQAIATKGGKTTIIANRFQQGGERGGIMHEVGHIGLEKAIGVENVGRLHKRIQDWKTDPRAKGVEREAVLAAEARIPETTKAEDRPHELIAYTAMELLNRGIKPETNGPGGQFLRALRNAFELVLRKLNLMDPNEHLTGKDLIDVLQYTVNRELRSTERAGKGGGEPMYSKRSEAHEAVQRAEARRDAEKNPTINRVHVLDTAVDVAKNAARLAEAEHAALLKEIPSKAYVTLEIEGPNGEPVEIRTKAKAALLSAVQRVNKMEALEACLMR